MSVTTVSTSTMANLAPGATDVSNAPAASAALVSEPISKISFAMAASKGVTPVFGAKPLAQKENGAYVKGSIESSDAYRFGIENESDMGKMLGIHYGSLSKKIVRLNNDLDNQRIAVTMKLENRTAECTMLSIMSNANIGNMVSSGNKFLSFYLDTPAIAGVVLNKLKEDKIEYQTSVGTANTVVFTIKMNVSDPTTRLALVNKLFKLAKMPSDSMAHFREVATFVEGNTNIILGEYSYLHIKGDRKGELERLSDLAADKHKVEIGSNFLVISQHNDKCNNCGAAGHYARNCKIEKKYGYPPVAPIPPVVLRAATPPPVASPVRPSSPPRAVAQSAPRSPVDDKFRYKDGTVDSTPVAPSSPLA
ncbi:hypothetical protein GQ42DRAFT_78266 [Ramicandelaber brevisporus]|nr:hypothetical protein GQ42DRAFT_78266 [Ramicandelaber brevisporus]